MHVLPPMDPDGWKRNFNSFLLIGQSTIVALALAGWIVWGGAQYTEITKQQEINTSAINELTRQLTVLTTRAESTGAEVAELRRWRDTLDSSIKDRRGELDGAIRAVATHAETNDDRIDKLEADATRMSDRQAATDARLNESLVTLKEMQRTVNDQSVSIEVIRAWVEEQRRASSRRVSPPPQ